jgi:prevent-host-death family protein
MHISVTQAARKFAECVNRVHYQGASFLLHKNGVPVARIVPVRSGADFEQLTSVPLEPRMDVQPEGEGFAVPAAEVEGANEGWSARKLPKRPMLNW